MPLRLLIACCWHVVLLVCAATSSAQLPPTVTPSSSSSFDDQLLESLSHELRPPSAAELQAAKQEVIKSLHQLRTVLSEQAIGVVLEKELQLGRLNAELAKEVADGESLTAIGEGLRRVLPDRQQHPVGDLRAKLMSLAQMVNLSEQGLQSVRDALAATAEFMHDEQQQPSRVREAEIRSAFATLARLHPSKSGVDQLRNRLSLPNHSALIKREFLVAVSRRSFNIPVRFQECKENTTIAGHGTFRLDIGVSLPHSQGENHLCVHASGAGNIQLTADRDRAHLQAHTVPMIQGIESLHIRPTHIAGDVPQVTAHLSTHVADVRIDGFLGRFDRLERLVARAVQNRLSTYDSVLARQIENTTREKVQDEGFELAHRVNTLLQVGIWDRIAALDFVPQVHLHNDSFGVRSDTAYARPYQLAALSKPPSIPSEALERLDLVTSVHESAVNNSFDSFSAMRVDEATVRGMWQVQLKLTSEEWDTLPPARVPAVITLADRQPVKLRFVPGGVEIVLRATACEVDGRLQDSGLRELRVRYVLNKDSDGLRLVRHSITCANTTPADKVDIWEETLGLFFGKSIRPMPKFRNSSFPEFMRMGYLNISDGWLVAGAERTSPINNSVASMQKEGLR